MYKMGDIVPSFDIVSIQRSFSGMYLVRLVGFLKYVLPSSMGLIQTIMIQIGLYFVVDPMWRKENF